MQDGSPEREAALQDQPVEKADRGTCMIARNVVDAVRLLRDYDVRGEGRGVECEGGGEELVVEREWGTSLPELP